MNFFLFLKMEYEYTYCTVYKHNSDIAKLYNLRVLPSHIQFISEFNTTSYCDTPLTFKRESNTNTWTSRYKYYKIAWELVLKSEFEGKILYQYYKVYDMTEGDTTINFWTTEPDISIGSKSLLTSDQVKKIEKKLI